MTIKKVARDEKGDNRPSISLNIALPFQLDRLFCDSNGRLTNTFELYGLESELTSAKAGSKGLWHQTLLLEGVNPRSTYEDPEGPDFFEPVSRAMGGWAELADLLTHRASASAGACPPSSPKRHRAAMSAGEAKLEAQRQEENMKLGMKLRAMTDSIEESEKSTEVYSKKVDAMKNHLKKTERKVVDLQIALAEASQENENLQNTLSQSCQFADEAALKLGEMESCANVAVANARGAVGYVNECMTHCAKCVEACGANKGQEAAIAAEAARVAGQLSFEAAQKAASVNNPSPISVSQQAYELAARQITAHKT